MTLEKNSQFLKFLFIWSGQFFSILGSGMTAFAIGVFIFEKTRSAASFSLILLCYFLPPFLFKPFGGILADRFDRRLMMVLGDTGSTLGLLFIFFMMQTNAIELWHIYAGISFSSLFNSIQEPAFKASVTDFLTPDQYAKASGLMQLSHASQYLISPFLAGILLHLINIKFIFLIDISTFLLANIIVLIIRKTIIARKKENHDYSFSREFTEGINEFIKNKNVMGLVFIISSILFFVGLLQALISPMILSFADSRTLGISQSLCASGMILGSLFLGLFGSNKKHSQILSISLFAAGLFFSLLGIQPNIVFVTTAGFMFFTTLPFINTSIEVLIRKNIDNEKQGRVWGIISSLTFSGSIIAFCSAGFLADKIFNPFMQKDSLFSNYAKLFVGSGNGRGIALMFVISGIMIILISLLTLKNNSIKELEK